MSFRPIDTSSSLANLVQTSFLRMFQAKSRKEFENVFDRFIAESASITMNGQPISRIHYREHLWRDQMNSLQSPVRTVSFKQIVEVPPHLRSPTPAGAVGMLYETEVAGAARGEELRIRVSVNVIFESSSITSSIGGLEAPLVTFLDQVVQGSGV